MVLEPPREVDRAPPPMPKEIITIGADHAGFELKTALKKDLADMGFETSDLGTGGTDPVDYPDVGHAVAGAVAAGKAARGVLICGTGIGMSIAANRHPGVRAALCHDEASAEVARRHNDANILALGARATESETARACLRAFLTTAFEGGRHIRRVEKLG